MKKVTLFFLAFVMTASIVLAGGDREKTPMVQYLEPGNDSVVNLKGKESLVFSWKKAPVPGGGRKAYKFDLYKGFGYEVVVGEKLNYKTYSIEVPADKFENGSTYTWQVKQRDANSKFWSMDHRWAFKVVK